MAHPFERIEDPVVRDYIHSDGSPSIARHDWTAMTELPTICASCAVRHRTVCGALSSEEIRDLNAIAHHRHLPSGTRILLEEEAPDYFANIVSGVVKLSKGLADGREQIVGLQFASEFLGRPFRVQSPYNAETVTDVHLCTFDRRRFERLAEQWPSLEHRLFSTTLDELDAAQEWMLLLGRKTARERVASFLMVVARRMEIVGCHERTDRTHRFQLPLSRGEIADFLGLTIETVSRQFTKLKVEGIVALAPDRQVTILNLQELERISAD